MNMTQGVDIAIAVFMGVGALMIATSILVHWDAMTRREIIVDVACSVASILVAGAMLWR